MADVNVAGRRETDPAPVQNRGKWKRVGDLCKTQKIRFI